MAKIRKILDMTEPPISLPSMQMVILRVLLYCHKPVVCGMVQTSITVRNGYGETLSWSLVSIYCFIVRLLFCLIIDRNRNPDDVIINLEY